MNRISILLITLAALSASFTSCTTTDPDGEARSGGISASESGMTRESIYEWQDRTFRQLAY